MQFSTFSSRLTIKTKKNYEFSDIILEWQWHVIYAFSIWLVSHLSVYICTSYILPSFAHFFKNFIYLFIFIYLWLCWVFISVRGLSLVAASGGHPSSRCAGLSLSRPLLLWSTSSRRAGSAIVAHGPSRSAACGILPDQGSNLCPLHWQADSQPLRHQGSPAHFLCMQLWFVWKQRQNRSVFVPLVVSNQLCILKASIFFFFKGKVDFFFFFGLVGASLMRTGFL